MNRNSRILLVLGLLGLLVIAGVLVLAKTPPKSPPASVLQANADQARSASAARPTPQKTTTPTKAEGPFVIKRILPIDGPIKYGEWHWDETGVPQGPIVVTVDLNARVLSIFRDGYEIGATAVLLGSSDKPTPVGVYPITQKDKDHVSNIYTGAPMPYMQRLTNDGITLHGSNVRPGYASHGCIGMPVPFAAKLFAATHLGDKVYVTRDKRVGLGASLTGS